MTTKAPPKAAPVKTAWDAKIATRKAAREATPPGEPSTTVTRFTPSDFRRLKSFNMDIGLMAAVEAKLAAQKVNAFVPPKGDIKVSPEVAAKLAKATSKEERRRIMLQDHFKVDPGQVPLTFTALVHQLLTEWVSKP